jgi:hypothetical protein
LAVIAPAVKLPLASRFTIALAMSAFVGATFQFSSSVPVRGDRRAAYGEVGDGPAQPDAGHRAFCRGCCRLNTCAGRARRWRGERES